MDLEEMLDRLMRAACACESAGNLGSAMAFARLAKEVDKAYRQETQRREKSEDHVKERG